MNHPKNSLLVCICGPTAVGKTAFSLELAEMLKCDIVNADSRQFYRELNIGTAKPSAKDLLRVKHHLINSKSIEEDYNVYDYEQDALSKLEEIFSNQDIVLMVGGSGLYLHAVWEGIEHQIPASDPEVRGQLEKLFANDGIEGLRKKLKELDQKTHDLIDLNNHVRIIRAIEICLLSGQPYSDLKKGIAAQRPFNVLKIGLNTDRELLHERINKRVDKMMDEGLETEVRSLISFRRKNALQTVGYQELFRYFDGELSLIEAADQIKINTRRYAKRQLSWLRRYEDINWFESNDIRKTLDLINRKNETLN
ncbi:MAG: tRNA (adenosine(37)-N6)-dimethylallyltransferase MiaA [Vicingaceae bacterium]